MDSFFFSFIVCLCGITCIAFGQVRENGYLNEIIDDV
jgi:hypothetical protein